MTDKLYSNEAMTLKFKVSGDVITNGKNNTLSDPEHEVATNENQYLTVMNTVEYCTKYFGLLHYIRRKRTGAH